MRSDGDGVVPHGNEIGLRVVGYEKDTAEVGQGGFLDRDRREETLKHGAHQPELGEDRGVGLLAEVVQD